MLLKRHCSVNSTIRYHAAAGHVLLKCHSVLDLGSSGAVKKICNILFLLISSPKVFSKIGWYSTRPINTSTKKCRKNIHACCYYYFLTHLRVLSYFLSTTLSSSLPFVTHIRGVTWQAILFFPHYRAYLRSNREKLTIHHFLEVSFPRVHLRWTGVHVTYHTQHNARLRGAFCGHVAYWCFCFRHWSGPERTHTFSYTAGGVYLHVLSYRYHVIYRMISVSRYILDIAIDISRKYRMIYREF